MEWVIGGLVIVGLVVLWRRTGADA